MQPSGGEQGRERATSISVLDPDRWVLQVGAPALQGRNQERASSTTSGRPLLLITHISYTAEDHNQRKRAEGAIFKGGGEGSVDLTPEQ